MSDETPTNPPPGPPGPPDPPSPDATVEQPAAPAASPADTTAEAPAATATSGVGSGKKVALGVGAVVAVAAIGGGAFAWTKLSGGGTQPHDVLPADTIAYVRLDLDPSANQKVNLLRLTKRVPEISKELGIDSEKDDLREIVLKDAVKKCDEISYDRDVKPWLGERVGVSIGSDLRHEDESIRIAVQVKDEDAAKAGVAKIADCTKETFGIAFLDGYAIVTPSQKSADAAVKAASDKPLADDADFKRDQDALDEQGVLSGWVDLKDGVAAAKEAGLSDELGLEESDLETLPGKAGGVAFALSATSTALSLDAVAREGDSADKRPEIRGLGALPGDTVVGVTLPGGGKAVKKDWDEIKSGLQDVLDLGSEIGLPGLGAASSPAGASPEFDAEAYEADPEGYQETYLRQLEERASAGSAGTGGRGADVDAAIEEIEKNLDVTLPEDLETLLGDGYSLYGGKTGLADAIREGGPSEPSDLAVGLVTEGDEKKAADLASRLVASIQRLTGVELASANSSDAVSLATSEKVADTLVKKGTLGDSELFDSVIRDDGKSGGLFIDVGAILDAAVDGDKSLADEEDIKDLRNIDAVGLSTIHSKDGYTGFSASVAFTKGG